MPFSPQCIWFNRGAVGGSFQEGGWWHPQPCGGESDSVTWLVWRRAGQERPAPSFAVRLEALVFVQPNTRHLAPWGLSQTWVLQS